MPGHTRDGAEYRCKESKCWKLSLASLPAVRARKTSATGDWGGYPVEFAGRRQRYTTWRWRAHSCRRRILPFSLTLERAVKRNDLNKINSCLEKLRIDRAEIEKAHHAVMKQLQGIQLRAVKWGVAGAACALYVARAILVHDVMTLSKTKN